MSDTRARLARISERHAVLRRAGIGVDDLATAEWLLARIAELEKRATGEPHVCASESTRAIVVEWLLKNYPCCHCCHHCPLCGMTVEYDGEKSDAPGDRIEHEEGCPMPSILPDDWRWP